MKTLGKFIIFTWILRIVFLVFAAFFLSGVFAVLSNNDEPPSREKAQYGVQTFSTDGFMIPSRIYFANEITYEGKIPSTSEYWWFDGEDYKHVKKNRVFNEPVEIIRRAQ